MAKKSKKPEFVPVNPDDLNPSHRWNRPLQAPGITQVDFEERVNFPRLHKYRGKLPADFKFDRLGGVERDRGAG